MQFTYYTDKTVAQCMSALNARLQQKGTTSRPGMEGWVEKNGNFALAVTINVMGRFPRTTRLQGKAERLGGMTVIKGAVADGVTPKNRLIILGALALVGGFIILSGNLLPGVIAIAAGLLLNIPLAGDHQNSQTLISEVQKTLRAKETPPVLVKKTAEVKKVTPVVKRTPATTSKAVSAKKSPAAKTTTPAAARVATARPATISRSTTMSGSTRAER
ncbi:MAG TPA: hypothetical protein VHO69_08530 [Phototrophicaceae bacterium]|nr:hypothetical protein [Phototrophicaceae bacterium]